MLLGLLVGLIPEWAFVPLLVVALISLGKPAKTRQRLLELPRLFEEIRASRLAGAYTPALLAHSKEQHRQWRRESRIQRIQHVVQFLRGITLLGWLGWTGVAALLGLLYWALWLLGADWVQFVALLVLIFLVTEVFNERAA